MFLNALVLFIVSATLNERFRCLSTDLSLLQITPDPSERPTPLTAHTPSSLSLKPRRRASFVSQFGTSLPPQPVVPGVGFVAPLETAAKTVSRQSTESSLLPDLPGGDGASWKWDGADEHGGGSPYQVWRTDRDTNV